MTEPYPLACSGDSPRRCPAHRTPGRAPAPRTCADLREPDRILAFALRSPIASPGAFDRCLPTKRACVEPAPTLSPGTRSGRSPCDSAECLCVGAKARLGTLLALGSVPVVATLASPDASDPSAKPHNLDDLDAGGCIWRPCTRLRALWGDFPVVVRVHSGAWEVAGNRKVRRQAQASLRCHRAARGNSLATRKWA